MDNKLYVLVREDLKPSYRAVQAGHALAQFLLQFPTEWKNGTLIYLGVDDEQTLYKWRRKLDIKNVDFAEFREPDIGFELTAIAAESDGRIFRNLRLMGSH